VRQGYELLHWRGVVRGNSNIRKCRRHRKLQASLASCSRRVQASGRVFACHTYTHTAATGSLRSQHPRLKLSKHILRSDVPIGNGAVSEGHIHQCGGCPSIRESRRRARYRHVRLRGKSRKGEQQQNLYCTHASLTRPPVHTQHPAIDFSILVRAQPKQDVTDDPKTISQHLLDTQGVGGAVKGAARNIVFGNGDRDGDIIDDGGAEVSIPLPTQCTRNRPTPRRPKPDVATQTKRNDKQGTRHPHSTRARSTVWLAFVSSLMFAFVHATLPNP
jgi:hypothetical protein